MLSLRLAKAEDALAVAILFKALYANSVYAKVMTYRVEDVQDLVISLAEDPEKGVTILLYDDDKLVGAMICSKMRQIFNQSEQTAVEIGFWITPAARSWKAYRMILGAYRYWAKRVGCTTIMYGKVKDDESVESYVIRKLK